MTQPFSALKNVIFLSNGFKQMHVFLADLRALGCELVVYFKEQAKVGSIVMVAGL